MKKENTKYAGFTFDVDGFPCVAVINSDLKDDAQRFEFPYSVFIEIIPEFYNEIGHPTEEESKFLNEIEDEIVKFLEAKTRSIHIGSTILPKKKEIIFYTKMPDAVKSFLERYLLFIQRRYNFEISLDEKWESVSGFYNQL